MTERYDAIVAGVGGFGSAALYHLARRGQRVLGLERFDVPHDLGSSGGVTRIIRLAYYEDPSYVPLLRRAYELWRELEAGAGEQLLHITGSVDAGPRSGSRARRGIDVLGVMTGGERRRGIGPVSSRIQPEKPGFSLGKISLNPGAKNLPSPGSEVTRPALCYVHQRESDE